MYVGILNEKLEDLSFSVKKRPYSREQSKAMNTLQLVQTIFLEQQSLFLRSSSSPMGGYLLLLIQYRAALG